MTDLIDAVWTTRPPATARTALFNHISRIRATHGEHIIRTAPHGYTLGVPTDLDELAKHVDIDSPAHAFEQLSLLLDEASGTPFADLDDERAAGPRRRAATLIVTAENRRLRAALELGRASWAAAEAERLVDETPFDEARWILLANALAQCGRRGDALATLDRARIALRDSLGLDPSPAWTHAQTALLGITATDRPGSAPSPFVGRQRELERLDELMTTNTRVLLTGEEGSGKTALLQQASRRWRSTGTVVYSRSSPTPAKPLAVLSEILDALGIAVEPVHGVIDTFVAAIRHASNQRNVIVIIDDLHVAGPSTMAALDAATTGPGVTLVASAPHHARTVLGESWATVELGPLDDAAITALVEQRRVRDDTPGLDVSWLAAMSGGNPQYLEALLDEHDRTHQAATPDTDTRRPGDRPLADLVRRQLSELGTITQAALEVAAVAGNDWPRLVLDELAPPAGVTAAFNAGLLVALPQQRTDFRHGAVQRVIYDGIAPGRRAELHHAVAQLLTRHGHLAATVAHHAIAASELDPQAAFTAACRAAGEATGQGAHRDAAAWYAHARRAAELLGPEGRGKAVQAAIGHADALRLSGDPTQDEALFAAADEAFTLGDPELIAGAATAVLSLGVTTATGQPHPRVGTLVDQAAAALGRGENWARVAGVASLAYSMSGAPQRCRTLFDDAEHLAVSDDARRAVLPTAYMALGLPGDLPRRAALGDELLRRALAADDPVAEYEARHLLLSASLQTCDGPAVRRHLAAMQAMIDRVGDVGRRWATLYQMAAVAHLDDRLDDSERLNDDALNIFSPISSTRALAAYGGQLLAIRHAQGRLDELTGVFQGLVDDQPEVPAWHAALALALVDHDPTAAATHSAVALDQVPEDFAWMAAHVIGGRAAARVADVGVVARYHERLTPWSGRACWQGTCCYGPVDLVLAQLAARLGDNTAAEAFRRRATDQCAQLEAPVFARELAEAHAGATT